MPDLAHAAAEHLAEAVGRGDGRAVAGQHRAHGRPQPLGEAHAHGVDRRRQLGQRDARWPRGRATGGPRPGARAGRGRGRPRPIGHERSCGRIAPARPVVGVLQADQPRRGAVDVVRADRGPPPSGQSRMPPGRRHAGQQHAREGRRGAGLVAVDVGAVLEHDLVAGPGLGPHGQLVAHGAAGHVTGRPPCPAGRPPAPAAG